jgi:hypothetical protein
LHPTSTIETKKKGTEVFIWISHYVLLWMPDWPTVGIFAILTSANILSSLSKEHLRKSKHITNYSGGWSYFFILTMLRLINHWVSYFITTTNTTRKLISSVRAKTQKNTYTVRKILFCAWRYTRRKMFFWQLDTHRNNELLRLTKVVLCVNPHRTISHTDRKIIFLLESSRQKK